MQSTDEWTQEETQISRSLQAQSARSSPMAPVPLDSGCRTAGVDLFLFTKLTYNRISFYLTICYWPMDPQVEPHVAAIVPPLDDKAHKGQSGRVCVVGGSLEFTGAPYFSAISSLKVGADLAYVLSSQSAAPVIKSYSPELIVYPLLDVVDGPKLFLDTILPRLHSLVVGPGMGRAQNVPTLLNLIVSRAKEESLPIVFDADSLFFINENLDLVKGYKNAILTPNVMEYRRLYTAVGRETDLPSLDESSESSVTKSVSTLASILGGLTILRKGPVDIASDGTHTVACTEKGSPRRCGGQGDILCGSLGTFAFWSSQAAKNNLLSQCPVSWPLVAAIAGCTFTRRCSRLAFAKHGRSTTASDLITEIKTSFESLFPYAP